MNGKLRSISLFSGYGGIDLALEEYSRPILYCEIEKYAQAILLSRMDDGALPFAPIWNDITTLDGSQLKGLVDIVYGGFPCQDISSAGKGAGLSGQRSGLFYEVIRICKEASPLFIFLENVAAIRTRGSIEVQEELASIGYDCRFGMLSAAEIGANHRRDRWFCLAVKRSVGNSEWVDTDSGRIRISDRKQKSRKQGLSPESEWVSETVANTISIGQSRQREHIDSGNRQENSTRETSDVIHGSFPEQWKTEPSVGRVVDGFATRSHELTALGNGVVPLQVKTAYEILSGVALV